MQFRPYLTKSRFKLLYLSNAIAFLKQMKFFIFGKNNPSNKFVRVFTWAYYLYVWGRVYYKRRPLLIKNIDHLYLQHHLYWYITSYLVHFYHLRYSFHNKFTYNLVPTYYNTFQWRRQFPKINSAENDGFGTLYNCVYSNEVQRDVKTLINRQ